MGDALGRISLTDKGISIIIHTYLIDTCTGIFHGLHCHCNWWARFVISYFDPCAIDKEQQQQQQPLSTTRSRPTFTILSLTTNPPKLHLSQTTFYQLQRKKSRTIPTGCVVTINEATQTYNLLITTTKPPPPPQCPGHPPPLPTLPQAASSPPKNPP